MMLMPRSFKLADSYYELFFMYEELYSNSKSIPLNYNDHHSTLIKSKFDKKKVTSAVQTTTDQAS